MEEIKKIVEFIENSEPPKLDNNELFVLSNMISGVNYGYNTAMKEVLEFIHESGF